MEFIKNKQKLVESMNELIDYYGNPKEIAKEIDELIFDYLGKLLESDDIPSSFHARMIHAAKALRDLLFELETN